MFARVATFEGVNIPAMEERARAALGSGEMTLPDGCRRAMALVDRHRLSQLFVTFFDSHDESRLLTLNNNNCCRRQGRKKRLARVRVCTSSLKRKWNARPRPSRWSTKSNN